MSRIAKLLSAAAVLALVLALAAPVHAFALRRLAVSSGSFKFTAGAGETVDGEVTVIDDGDEPLKVLVYSADQNVDNAGKVSFSVPSRADLQSSNQPSAWMHVFMPADSKSIGNIPYLDMTPHQRVLIKFQIAVPPDVTPGDHNVMLFYEMLSGNSVSNATGANITGRLGTRVQLRVKGQLVERLDLARFAVPPIVIGQGVPVDFTLTNVGNTDQRIVASVRLLNHTDDSVSEVKPINNELIFAQKNREVTATLMPAGTLFGPYTARLEVTPVDDNGQPTGNGSNVVIEKKSLWILPAWAVIIAIVLLVGIILWIVFALGRGSARRRAARQAEKQQAAAAAAPAVAPGQPDTSPDDAASA